jgi:hypothetical protein
VTFETGVESLPREEPGGSLLTGQVGVRHEWWRERGLGSCAELGNLSPRWDGRPVARSWPAAGLSGARTPSSRSARGRVVMRGTGADLTVVCAGLAVLLAGGSPVGPTPSGVRSQ